MRTPPQRGRHVALLSVLLAGLVALAAGCSSATTAGGTPSVSASPGIDPELVVPSDRIIKADLIEKLDEPPQLIFFGGSRSQRFDPVYAQKVTGLRGFNLALTHGKAEDAWAFANWFLERSPDTRLRWVWGISQLALEGTALDTALLQDPRLSKYFPERLLAAQAAELPQTKEEVPTAIGKVLEGRTYAADGLLVRNQYDDQRDAGRTTAKSVRLYLKGIKERARAKAAAAADAAQAGDDASAESAAASKEHPESRQSTWYFEKTIKLLNDHGTTPLMVLMPVHPTVLAAMPGWQKGRVHMLAYLTRLKRKYDLTVLDLTNIASFGGDPNEFYDGVHTTIVNSDRAIKRMVEAAPREMK